MSAIYDCPVNTSVNYTDAACTANQDLRYGPVYVRPSVCLACGGFDLDTFVRLILLFISLTLRSEQGIYNGRVSVRPSVGLSEPLSVLLQRRKSGNDVRERKGVGRKAGDKLLRV